jgi:XrtN system VIT domain protein
MSKSTTFYRLGLVLIVLLFPLYLSMSLQWLPERWIQDPLGLVMMFFLTATGYLIGTTTLHVRQHGWKRFHRSDEKQYSVALVLFSLSAHALNLTEIRVFEPYVPWMQGYVWLIHGAVLLFPYRGQLPDWGNYALFFLNGAGLVLCIYLTIFLGPLILIAIPASIALGLSLHATVPLWLSLRLGASYWQVGQLPYAKRAYWAGIMLPLMVLVGFMQQWQATQDQITRPNQVASADLPRWVAVAQQLPDHFLTEQVLLNEGINQQGLWGSDWGLGILGNGGRGEFRRHDPLGIMARALYGELPITRQDLGLIMEARYDARHMTHRRLWRGKDLMTSSVSSTIDLYPTFRLAYQEMTLRIRNTTKRRLGRQQEAVYSFHLPPGAVASSLSLWVEGEERPSVLTTRAKADSAYETIVGIERRDPALLHWQEGNRVTITIFPCTPEEERQVKIGFTMPLIHRDGQLTLPNVPFDGPATWQAEQQTDVHLHGIDEAEGLRLPLHWSKISATHWRHQGRYQAQWLLSLNAPALSQESFSWQDQTYRLQVPSLEQEPWRPQRIYLDINATWSNWAIEQVWALVEDHEIYVFAPSATRLTADNRKALVALLRQQRFTLPPLYQIEDPAQSLVISASTGNTPLLSDLDGTEYATNMGEWLSQLAQPLRWVNLSEDLAPFAQTLYDLRVINLHRCDRAGLETLLEKRLFPRLPESPNHMYLPSAEVQVVQASGAGPTTEAPDHLFRLFAYQKLLRSIGRAYYDRAALEESWLRQAEAAFIVSPVSSLLVLETDEDYERFGIDPNRNTLGNAIATSAGTAPEPHEWVLILLAGIAMLLIARHKGWV